MAIQPPLSCLRTLIKAWSCSSSIWEWSWGDWLFRDFKQWVERVPQHLHDERNDKDFQHFRSQSNHLEALILKSRFYQAALLSDIYIYIYIYIYIHGHGWYIYIYVHGWYVPAAPGHINLAERFNNSKYSSWWWMSSPSW